jgi:phosphate transport system permease protein
MEPLPLRDVPRAAGALDGGGAARAPARSLEALGRGLLAALTALVLAALVALVAALLLGGAAALRAHPDALRPALAALARSLRLAALATALALPPGLALGLWLARVAGTSRLARAVRAALDAAAALPGVVFGLAGWALLAAAAGLRGTTAAMAIVLALLNLPWLSSRVERALRAVPVELEEASLALGASHVQTILRVSLPHAARGVLGALVLCLGRSLAECAPLLCVAPATAEAPLTMALWRAPTDSPGAAVSAAFLALLAVATTAAGRRLR